jgi:sugar phosphate isomerase/epimerase
MYKRCVITDEISQDLSSAIAMASYFRLDGIEVRSLWGERVDQLSSADLDRVAGLAHDAGLCVAAIAAPCFKCDLGSAEQYREHIGILLSAIRAAHALGTPLVRMFTFWKDRPLDQAYADVLAAFSEPIRIAEGEGITLAVENEASAFIATGEQTARLLTDLGTPTVQAIWDPGNAYYDVLRERAYPVGYEAVRDRIVHVHLKDCATNPETGKLEWVVLGTGEIDIRGQLAALVADGYDGFVSLETHYRPKKLPEAALRLPSGKAFSELGAQATFECLAAWDSMLDR